jgi:hypothetical protein
MNKHIVILTQHIVILNLFQDSRQRYFVILKQVQDNEGTVSRDDDIVVGACIGFPT